LEFKRVHNNKLLESKKNVWTMIYMMDMIKKQ
jgi:hypothetical protein